MAGEHAEFHTDLPGTPMGSTVRAEGTLVDPRAGDIAKNDDAADITPPPHPTKPAPPPRGRVPPWLDPRPPSHEFSHMSAHTTVTSQFASTFYSSPYHSALETSSEPGSEHGDVDDIDGGRVTLSKLQEFLAAEVCLKRNCQTLPLTLVLWIIFSLLVFNHGAAETSYETMRVLEDAIHGASVPAAHDGTRPLRFDTIREHGDILRWVENGLVPVLHYDGRSYGQILEKQQLVGFVRVSQTRGKAGACEGLSDELVRFYDGECHPAGGSVGAYGPADAGDYAYQPARGPGNRFVAWIEVGRSLATIRRRLRALEAFHWVDLGTRLVEVEAVFLNAEVHVYTHVRLAFTLHREGWIEPELSVRPVRGDVYTHWSNIFLDVIWISILAVLIYQAGHQVHVACRAGLMGLHLRDPYMWLDWLSITVGLAIGIFFWALVVVLDSYANKVIDLGAMPQYGFDEAPEFRAVQSTLDNLRYQAQLTTIIDDLHHLSTVVVWHRLCAMCYSFVVVLRFFRAFTGQPRIAVLIQTIAAATEFLLHYLVVFAVVFCNFAIGGYILFGEQSEGWSTLGQSINRLFLLLFGKFDHEEFRGISPVTAIIWLWTFYISVVVLLVNLLTAILVHRYLDVRARLGAPGAGLHRQIRESLQELLWARSYEGSQKSIPTETLLERLCGAGATRIRHLGQFSVDHRLRTHADIKRAEGDPAVDVAYLVERGCDAAIAERLLQRCASRKYQIAAASTPMHRMMLLLAHQMRHVQRECDGLAIWARAKVDIDSACVDRIDLKHAKCFAMARRVRHAQELPAGWTAHKDSEGRRFLRHEETGLTSWTLPRHMI